MGNRDHLNQSKVVVFANDVGKNVYEHACLYPCFDLKRKSFSLWGAPVGVVVLAEVFPSSFEVRKSGVWLEFDHLSEAEAFAKALMSAAEYFEDLCGRASD